MKGYFHLADVTAESFLRDGGFLPGDVGQICEKGILYITDSKKDMIIMSGWKIYPAEVENVPLKHPAILGCCGFRIPDIKKGEIPGPVECLEGKGSPGP